MKSELIKEIWKPVPNYDGLYEASNFGRVRSLSYMKSKFVKILKPHKTYRNYQQMRLCNKGKQKWFCLHRLIWETFHGEIPEGYEVNHIDENPSNNRLDNLNLLTHKENINWGTRNKKVSEKLTGRPKHTKVSYGATPQSIKTGM